MNLRDDAVLSHSPRASFRDVGGERVVVVSHTQELHVLSPVGAEVWDLIDGVRSLAAIIDEVESRFDAVRAQVATDVTAFAAELATKGAVVVNDGGPL